MQDLEQVCEGATGIQPLRVVTERCLARARGGWRPGVSDLHGASSKLFFGSTTTSFTIVDDATCTGPPGTPICGRLGGGFQDTQNRAWIQNQATATVDYDGSGGALTSVDNVNPIFGTDGRTLVPEPGTATLLGLGLLGLGVAGRRLP